MPELLQRATQMKVTQARSRLKVRANCVYVIPPNKDMSILHGSLFLFPPVENKSLRLPINYFFKALADDQHERAVAVILSGMGSDGTLGLTAIKENAGLAVVQSPESCKFDSMPQSAIDAGLADIVAPPEEMPKRIMEYLTHTGSDIYGVLDDKEQKIELRSQSAIEQIILILRERNGNDFSLYKKNTIYRRIARRMELHQLKTITLYARYLRDNPQEQDLLFKELLIGVTNFFRDKEVWTQLKSVALPALIANYPHGKELRAWVTACSTGEEAYSLAMTLTDVLADVKPKGSFKLQIFATDLDEDAINIARQGNYLSSIEADVSPQQLERYFIKDEKGYRINKEIRDMVIFAKQNIIMDPPFTKLDIVTCRNLLIYFGGELQQKLLPLFHYVLSPHGVLVLGNAESIGNSTLMFSTLNDNARIYNRIETSNNEVEVDFPSRLFPVMSNEEENTATMNTKLINLQEHADQILLQHYSPAAVLINAVGDILYINGRTGKYLEPAAGKANWNIHVMARGDLAYHLDEAIKQAKDTTEIIIIKKLTVDTYTFDLSVQALKKPESMQNLLMVVFTEVKIPAKEPSRSKSATEKKSKNELVLAQEQIQVLRERMQTSQEELKSTNEELQSTNEELQSTNEELTTSKEEMQSMNEELQTVNAELQSNVDDLSWVNNDMKNLLDSTEIATIFLDGLLKVRRYTAHVSHLFKLIPSDIGRPLSDIVTALDYTELENDMKRVLQSLIFIEKDIKANSDRYFKVRIMPYRTQENMIDGVVITFIDISSSKQIEAGLEKSQRELEKSLEDLERIFNLSVHMICIASSDGTFKKVSPAFSETLGFSEKELLSQPYIDFVHPDDKKATIEIMETVARGIPITRFRNRYICKDGTSKWLEWTARSFANGEDRYAVAYDITEQMEADATLSDALAMLESQSDGQADGLSTNNVLETILSKVQALLQQRLKPATSGLIQAKQGKQGKDK
jgi:chemotaxis protein methyltransferase CheR/two-component system CheB/CheR fusion protein